MPRMLRAGDLDRWIRIETPIYATSEFGDRRKVTGWSKVVRAKGKRADVPGRELVQGGAERAEFTTRFMIRDPKCALDPRMRVIDETAGGQVFSIYSIPGMAERGAGFEVLCRNADGVGSQT